MAHPQNFFYNLTSTMYNASVTLEISTARLVIADGVWQDNPETLAVFGAGVTRGTLYLATEVIGETPERDPLARQMIEIAQKFYAGTRGSITLALIETVRAVNEFFYQRNLNAVREARCIAGITIAVLRDEHCFIAQGGPGLVLHARGNALQKFPATSPWFSSEQFVGDFPTPGAVPIGLRRDYTPDLSYLKLQTGDALFVATRALVQLFSDDEISDAMIGKPVDAMIENLEDLAGSADLAAIAIRAGSVPAELSQPVAKETPQLEPPSPPAPIPTTAPTPVLAFKPELEFEPEPELDEPEPLEEIEEIQEIKEEKTPPPAPTEEEIAAIKLREEQRRARNARIKAGLFGAGSLATRGLAGIGSRVNAQGMGEQVDRALAGFFRLVARLIRAAVPGAPKENRGVKEPEPEVSSAWKFAALIFPLVMLSVGGWTWYQYRVTQERLREQQFAGFIDQANAYIKNADDLSKTDKIKAKQAADEAFKISDQACALAAGVPCARLSESARGADAKSQTARSVWIKTQDVVDKIAGIEMLVRVPAFENFADPKAKPARLVAHLPEVYVLDRGTNRIYQYKMDDAAQEVQRVSTDGIILKGGTQVADRIVGELIDMMWIDAGRLAAFDRAGNFLQYDPGSVSWRARVASDGNQWARVNLAGSFLNNLYLLDPARNQILKYVPVSDAWSASTTFFQVGVTPDLNNTVDLGVDTDIWILRRDGSVLRYSQGRPVDFSLQGLDIPLKDPIAISVPVPGASIFIADAGNQRIVQFDKNTGKFVRSFKPGGEYRNNFSALKTLAVDEVNKKIFIVNGSQVLFSNLP